MPETVRVNQALDIIEVMAVGEVGGEDIAESLKKITALSASTGIRCVLVDVTEQKTEPNLSEMFELMVNLPDQTKFALLSTAQEGLLESHKFGETVAGNRGLALKLFSDRDQAVDWLQNG